jgi:hypothetical protein
MGRRIQDSGFRIRDSGFRSIPRDERLKFEKKLNTRIEDDWRSRTIDGEE